MVRGAASDMAIPGRKRVKNLLAARLLKKVQMQGGVTHPEDGSQQMGLFQQLGGSLS